LVSDGVPLLFPESDANKIAISDRQGKEYLNFERSGAVSNATSLISDLTQSYVAFSGHNFEHVLVPLMRDNDVMINPDRPLVIYESMSVDLERFDVTSPQLILEKSTLDVDGRRGKVRMQFRLTSDQGDFGHGEKSMILSGLRPADPAALQGMLDDYIGFKATYTRPDQVP
ncbi:MAG: DUF3581 family protein, partial [Chromatiales bacterium]